VAGRLGGVEGGAAADPDDDVGRAFLATSVMRSISRWEQTPPKTSRLNSTPASENEAASLSPASFQTFSSAITSGCLPISATWLPREASTPRPWM
jgi:hypothetical protein